ncbi:hypothetical protein TCAL_15487 [Tigriopus californicus]|uniref:Uncharacterized protein n=1 Tax=Tigriopus californicus TaxID=6832 RepID=A0A553PT68_TIGCA|nr:hypothetical protein TCAL_15487 [Tigriopus californicus]
MEEPAVMLLHCNRLEIFLALSQLLMVHRALLYLDVPMHRDENSHPRDSSWGRGQDLCKNSQGMQGGRRKRDIDEAQLEFETERKKLIIIQQEEASFKAKIVKLEFAAKKVEIQRKLNLTDQELEDLLH